MCDNIYGCSLGKYNFMRHEIQGGRHYYKKYKKEAFHLLTLKPQFQNYAQVNLHNIAKKVQQRMGTQQIEFILEWFK